MTETAKTARPRIYGSAGDDTMAGTSDADTMCGGLGNDGYVVNNQGDVIIEYANQGYDTVYASIDYRLDENVEALVLTGKAVYGTGNALDNVI
jgi:Ca2+-binding RTX toxin-like protein